MTSQLEQSSDKIVKLQVTLVTPEVLERLETNVKVGLFTCIHTQITDNGFRKETILFITLTEILHSHWCTSLPKCCFDCFAKFKISPNQIQHITAKTFSLDDTIPAAMVVKWPLIGNYPALLLTCSYQAMNNICCFSTSTDSAYYIVTWEHNYHTVFT